MASFNLGFSWKKVNFDLVKSDSRTAVFNSRRYLSQIIFDMAALEGNPYTYVEVQTLLEGITIGGHKLSDQQEILNLSESWKYLLQTVLSGHFQLQKQTYLMLHKKVAQNLALSWGEFRQGPVRIGGTEYLPPEADKLDLIFDTGLEQIKTLENPFEQACVFFLWGALNQFFWDGNKRTARLMLNGILLSHGMNAVNIPAAQKQEFNQKMIDFYDHKEASEMMQFLKQYILT